MKKIEVFRLPKQLYFLRIEDWQVAFCNGDKCAAAILDFFANRHRFYLEKLEEVEQRNKALNQSETVDPFMVQTISKISDYTLGMFGRNKIIEAIQYLVENGVISEKKDLQNNKSYCLNTEPVQVFIDSKWIPFIESLGKDENPLQSYLLKIGFSQLKRKSPSLKSNDETASLKSNEASLISNDETGFTSLISNDPSLISNDNKVINSTESILVIIDSNVTQPNGSEKIDAQDVEDFEEQIRLQKLSEEKSRAKKIAAVEKPKSKKRHPESKWNGSFQIAKDIFDEQRNQWSINRFSVKDNGIYWTGKEIGQLSNLLTMLKSKAAQNGDVYETDVEFVQSELPIFLAAAAKLDRYYSNEFTPTLFSSKFNTVITDIKNYLKNGNINNSGRNGHQFDAERTRYMESLLD